MKFGGLGQMKIYSLDSRFKILVVVIGLDHLQWSQFTIQIRCAYRPTLLRANCWSQLAQLAEPFCFFKVPTLETNGHYEIWKFQI